jgi:hypothetical protein
MGRGLSMAKKSVFDLKRPPRIVTVCGHKIKVKVIPYLEDDTQELLGAFNGETKTIFLLKGCDWRSVLLHECIHACLYFSGSGEGLTMSREEQITISLEMGLGPLIF